MAEVYFRNEQDGSDLSAVQVGTAQAVEQIRGVVVRWADANHFAQVVFWRDAADVGRYWVQLDDQRLNYWIPASTFQGSTSEQIEMQLDYARGAQRRSAAGYDRFDR